jgi:[ribosomal protein S18]-alanine N-acetyltransferase
MKTNIRFMEEKDIPIIVKYDRIVFGQSIGEGPLETEMNENPFAFYFVMENPDNSAFLGYVGLWIDVPLAQILNIYIIPEYREQGLGKILMDQILQFLKSREINTLTLEVRPSNTRAIDYYKKFGFSKVATRKQYYENGEDADLMLKNIE